MKSRIALLGAPATGKGTQAALLSAAFRIPTFSTGAAMRAEVSKGSPLGQRIGQTLEQGALFPDHLALELVWRWIGFKTRFLLDGFPRTLPQALAFDQELAQRNLALEAVILLELAEPLIRERVANRLTCPGCSAVFQLGFHQLQMGDPCPICSTPLMRRLDDSEESLDLRLREYRFATLPVADYYAPILLRVDASQSREAVFRALYDYLCQ